MTKLHVTWKWNNLWKEKINWHCIGQNWECLDRWMCGVQLRDKLSCLELRQHLGIEGMAKALYRNRLWWYGHVMMMIRWKMCYFGGLGRQTKKNMERGLDIDKYMNDFALKTAWCHGWREMIRGNWSDSSSDSDPVSRVRTVRFWCWLNHVNLD